MNAEEFTSIVANLGRPGEPEEEAAALQRLIGMARKVTYGPHLPNKVMFTLRCAQADLEGLLSEAEDPDHPGYQTLYQIKEVISEVPLIPNLEMLRTAVRLLDQAALGQSDAGGKYAMTDDEILNAQAAARANVAQFIIEADPMGPEAADQGLAQEVAGTEVDGPRMTIEEWLGYGIEESGQGEMIDFCEFLQNIQIGMREEGETEDAIKVFLLTVANEFIGVAESFKLRFGC